MKKLLIVFLLCSPMWATISVVHAKQNCTATPCTVTSTTAANFFLIGTDTASEPTAAHVTLGSQTSTAVSCEWRSAGSPSWICAWVITSVTGGQTSVACSDCGKVNALIGIELSGIDTVNYRDAFMPCYQAGGTSPCNDGPTGASIGIPYAPSYSNEFIYFQANCQGIATTVTGTGVSLTASFPSGEPNAYGVIASASSLTVTSNCNNAPDGAFVLGLKGAGASLSLNGNLAYQDYTAVNTSGNATITAYVANVGDFVGIVPWCLPSCTNPQTSGLTLGSQSATCSATASGVSSSNTGQGWICYVLSANTAGANTITYTPGGSPTQYQLIYQDFVLGGTTAMSHDVDAVAHCDSGCSEGTTVTTPSITPSSTGELLLNFVTTLGHTTGVSGSWGCFAFVGSGDTLDCWPVTTINMPSWILSSASGSTSSSTTILNSNDPFQSIISAFKYSNTAGGAVTNSAATSWF